MSLFYIIFTFLISLFTSCSSVQNNIKKSHYSIHESTREKTQGQGFVKLFEHQLLPIDYLHKNPDLKGILVNHYMGTGKTNLGIGMAESFADHPVIILAPRFLHSNWRNELKLYGVRKPERYKFISYDEAPHELMNLDLSNYILLADEVHNLVKYMRSYDKKTNELYTKLYINLRNAYKIIGLTGTPVYGDESDIAFLINFVSGKDLMPFNQETFRLNYTKLIPHRQFFRGYFSESNLVVYLLPMALVPFGLGLIGPLGLIGGVAVGVGTPVALNYFLDLDNYKLRELNVAEMKGAMNKYISFFKFSDDHFKDFPQMDYQIIKVPYNHEQYSFFLHLVEGDLSVEQLQRLLKYEGSTYSDEFLNINSSVIHEQFYSSVGAGRDIGNFDFKNNDGAIIEPPKFMRIYEELLNHNEQTVIYSNYYHTGILAFKEFLKRHNYKEPYAIIEPSMSIEEVDIIVKNYNQEKIKLLMLHPEITEGISLRGTQYLHVLEPLLNSTVLEQVIGRTRRFKSHSHLPLEKQKVYVRMWQSSSSSWNPTMVNLKRVNWYRRYREVAYMSRWGIGITQVDKKYHRKALNPEELAVLKLKTLEKNLLSMQRLLQSESIEQSYAKY
jgi:hypothetical protein